MKPDFYRSTVISPADALSNPSWRQQACLMMKNYTVSVSAVFTLYI
jgi:hypothetical protein